MLLPLIALFSMLIWPDPNEWMATPVLLKNVPSTMETLLVPSASTPLPAKPYTLTWSRMTVVSPNTCTPFVPSTLVPAPLIWRLRSVTVLVWGAANEVMLMMTPCTPEERMLACVPTPLIVIGLVMVTVPKPPGSSASISPPAAVFEIAPAHVLHGAGRLPGFTSSPTPETHVRVAWANATELPRDMHATNASAVRAE